MEILETEISIAVKRLYPDLTEAGAKQAGHNLCRYFETVIEIQRRESAAEESKVDSNGEDPTIKERSNQLKT